MQHARFARAFREGIQALFTLGLGYQASVDLLATDRMNTGIKAVDRSKNRSHEIFASQDERWLIQTKRQT
jgi:hypothetical protein